MAIVHHENHPGCSCREPDLDLGRSEV